MRPDDSTILVLGNGGFGSALALVLLARGVSVRLWGHDAEYTERIARTRRNPKFLPGVEIPAGISVTSELAAALEGVDGIVSAVPTQFVRATFVRVASLDPTAYVVSCSKGFEKGTLERPSEILREALPSAPIGVLSGPSHAEEIARGLATTVVVASENPDVARTIQALFSTQTFRAYTSDDPIGVEFAGAAKNVIAVAAGIADGLGFGDNARAALVCRGSAEITRVGCAVGAKAETFAGLSGIGDLVATCTSEHSRNRAVGLRLGRGETLEDILKSTEKVAEGVETTRGLVALADRHGVDVPITREVHAVLFEGKDPRDAVVDLMTRAPREETDRAR